MNEFALSPCTKVCAIDVTTGWCLGCGRTMDEIGTWSQKSDAERQAICAELDKRLPLIENRAWRAERHRLPGS